MSELFESSIFLKEIWKQLNENIFDNKLNTLSAIGWHSMGEGDNHGDFGQYSHTANAMSLSRRFYILEEKNRELDSYCSDSSINNADKKAKIEQMSIYLDIAYGLVAHEMAHQAVCQFSAPTYDHGPEFQKWANTFYDKAEFPLATSENASFWPPSIHVCIKETGI